jgi:hypothetical protein
VLSGVLILLVISISILQIHTGEWPDPIGVNGWKIGLFLPSRTVTTSQDLGWFGMNTLDLDMWVLDIDIDLLVLDSNNVINDHAVLERMMEIALVKGTAAPYRF